MSESLCPLLDEYLKFVEDTEPPTLYHRWCFLTGVAAMLHRKTHIDMRIGKIYPNIFTVLLGCPGARKSTAIDIMGGLIKRAGYTHIASGKTSPEQFLVDLKNGYDAVRITANDIDLAAPVSVGFSAALKNLSCAHALIKAGELQDFLGSSNIAFLSLLTNLWDNPADYPYRVKDNRGSHELIIDPTISLLGGATPVTFKRIFPLEVVGQGLLSRFILVHGAGARKKIWMPEPLCTGTEATIVNALTHINSAVELPEVFTFSPSAAEFSRILYEQGEEEITDPRFQHYANRRNIHYMKLCMVIAAMNFHQQIEDTDCFLANTILTYTEKFMPLALGEFGLDHAAEVTEYLYQLIKKHPEGISLAKLVENGLAICKTPGDLASHLNKLIVAKRVEKLNVHGAILYIPIQRIVVTKSKMVDFEYLKEYNENPNFDTAYEPSQEKLLEWELRAATEAVQAELEGTKKLIGKSSSKNDIAKMFKGLEHLKTGGGV